MKGRRSSDIENTEELPVIHPDQNPGEKDFAGRVLPVFARIGLFLAIVLIITLISRFLYIRINGEPLSLIDDTQLVFSGHNGNGYADAVFHPENTALNQLKSKRDHLKKEKKDTTDINAFIQSIGCRLDYKDHLSNGMTVTYTCDYDEKAAKKAGYHVINDVRSYTVMGLSDYTYIDPYQGLKTEWNTDGETPVLKITPAEKYKDLFSYTYTCHGGTSVTIHTHPDEQALHRKGYEVLKSRLNQTITVPSKPEQIRNTESLTSEETDKLKQQTVHSYEHIRNTCDTYSEDHRTLQHSDVSVLSWNMNSDGTCTAFLSVTNVYSQNGIPVSYSFTVSCTGTIWRKADGTVSFSLQSDKTCAFLRQGDLSVTEK